MKSFKRKSGILIPRDYEETEWAVSIKNYLTRRSLVYGSEDEIQTQRFYIETKNYIIIPRFFPIKDYVDCKVIDETYDGEDIEISANIVPRNKLQQRAISYLKENDNGIIELQPATGKTVISIYDICYRKKKTLILVYLTTLCNQWKDRLLEHTNLTEDDILLVKSNNFKKMSDHKIIISTNQTFISLLKRKQSEFLTEIKKSNIGIFISDEAHTSVGAITFSMCSLNVPSKVTRGLSATPERSDGNSDIIEYHMGPIFSDESYEGTNTNVECTFILVDYGIDQPKRYKYLYWKKIFNRARYLNLMANPKHSPRFHRIVKGLINKFKDSKDMIVMSERNKLIDILYDWTEFNSKSKFNKNEDLDKLNYKVTFSTPMKIRDGIDAPWKELVILTSPISNIKQMTGRVCRSYPDKEKVTIIDMVDIGCYEISKTFKFRRDFYKKNNWKLKFLAVDLNGNINEITESNAEKFIYRKGE